MDIQQPEIRRYDDGSIDIDHYVQQAYAMRRAYLRGLFRRKQR